MLKRLKDKSEGGKLPRGKSQSCPTHPERTTPRKDWAQKNSLSGGVDEIWWPFAIGVGVQTLFLILTKKGESLSFSFETTQLTKTKKKVLKKTSNLKTKGQSCV